jgi:hypothetical protein
MCLLVLIGLLCFLSSSDLLTPVIFFVLITLMFAVLGVIYPAASYVASNSMDDKSSASGMMNFINMGAATIMVSVMGYLPYEYIWNFILVAALLPVVFLGLIIYFKPRV